MRRIAAIGATLVLLACAAPARGDVVGDIQGVYFATNPFGISPVLDGPAFVFENTSGAAITGGVFTILAGNGEAAADSFNVGTIAAGGKFIIETGITSDGGSGHTFFAVIGGGFDTSETGAFNDNTQFRFTGLQGAVQVTTGIFTPGMSKFASNDGVIASMNFLGGPGDNDGPCGNCYGPHIIATMSTVAVPEPASWALAGLGFAGVFASTRRRAAGKAAPAA